MTLRVIQQTHYYENQTRKFLQGQWSRMTLKIIRTWETEIACTASNIRHTIKWTRILARRRLPRPEGTIVRNRDPDVKCGERPPVDGGRNPEEVVEALEPSHWRETPSTPIPAENDMAHLVADFVHTWRLQAAWRYFARGVLRRR